MNRKTPCKSCSTGQVSHTSRSGLCRKCWRASLTDRKKYEECQDCGKPKTYKQKNAPLCWDCYNKRRCLTEDDRVVRAVRNRMGCRMRAALALKEGKSMFEFLPYTMDELRDHIEAQFSQEMSWDNYGSYWHLDHIVPHSRLPYKEMSEVNFLRCWSLENLQPLPARENLRKSNKITEAAKALLEKWDD